MEQLLKYFPDLTTQQKELFSALPDLYAEWNKKINVISRKDIDNIYERHIIHSLGIAKVLKFLPNSNILDVGTGGGFPGIPLAILFPETQFHLIDSIGKKITVVKSISEQLGLKNVKAEQIRAEQISGSYDFIVCRAVTDLSDFTKWVKGKISSKSKHSLHNGILCLKGGDLNQELEPFYNKVRIYSLSDYFSENFYETKKIVYLKY